MQNWGNTKYKSKKQKKHRTFFFFLVKSCGEMIRLHVIWHVPECGDNLNFLEFPFFILHFSTTYNPWTYSLLDLNIPELLVICSKNSDLI